MKILAIIPAYNEDKSIGDVVASIRENAPFTDILVVNDGSRDNTGKKARYAGALVVDLPFNLGIGGAVQTGYIYAWENGYDYAIQVDGDGQHDPRYISALLEPLERGDADMAIGSRYVGPSGYKASMMRKTGMVYFSWLVKVFTGRDIKDTTSGFRAVNKKVIAYFAKDYPLDYPEVDVLVKLHRKKFKVTEIPVEMKTRANGKSSITPSRSVYYMIKVSLSLFVEAIRSQPL